MKISNIDLYFRSIRRNITPRQTYTNGFNDETRGYAMVVSGGRLIEKISRRKIFYQKYI